MRADQDGQSWEPESCLTDAAAPTWTRWRRFFRIIFAERWTEQLDSGALSLSPFLNTTATNTPPPYCTTTSQAREREREREKSRSWGHLFCALIWALTQVSGVQTGWRGRRGCEPPLTMISQPHLSYCSTGKWERISPTQWPWGGRTTESGWGQRGGDKWDISPSSRNARTRCPCARQLCCQTSRQVAHLLCVPEKSNYSRDNLMHSLYCLFFSFWFLFSKPYKNDCVILRHVVAVGKKNASATSIIY